MDNRTVFEKTNKGEDEARSKVAHLSGDIRRALLMVDGTATFAEISKRAAPSLRAMLNDLLLELLKAGFIQDKAKIANIPRMVVPTKTTVPNKIKENVMAAEDELDFTAAYRVPTAEMLAAEAAKINIEKTKAAQQAAQASVAELQAKQEAERRAQESMARQKAQQESEKMRVELVQAKAKAESEAKLRVEQAAQAKLAAEAAQNRAQAEAESARMRATQEADKAKQAAEAARLKAEQEAAQVRAELAAAKARAEEEAKSRALAEEKLRQEAEAAKLKAQQEAEQIRIEAERAAAARAEAERIAKQAAEAARLKAEQEAAQVRAELAAAKARAEEEAKSRALAEEKLRQEAEAAKLKAQQEAEQIRIEAERAAAARAEAERIAKQAAEAARQKAEQEAAQVRAELAAAKARAEEEAKSRALAEEKLRQEADAAKVADMAGCQISQVVDADLLLTSGLPPTLAPKNFDKAKLSTADDMSARSTSATVLFFDVVEYTKQSVNKQIVLKNQFNQLVSAYLNKLGDDERIILDTGDGAAIGFMQHPEDALKVALQFRNTVLFNQHQDHPDLKVRIGIHIGPINIIRDMNGQSNMVGDGINDAQRVMSFAAEDQVFVSRAYYDFVSRLSDEYAEMFEYRGMQEDKHGRKHQVYQLIDVASNEQPVIAHVVKEDEPPIQLQPFDLAVSNVRPSFTKQNEIVEQSDEVRTSNVSIFTAIMSDIGGGEAQTNQIAQPVKQDKIALESAGKPQNTADDNKLLVATQAKVWAEAEQRAIEAAKNDAQRSIQQATPTLVDARGDAINPKITERIRRKPIPWTKLAAALLLMCVAGLFVVPAVVPMKGYREKIAKVVTEETQQSVHIGEVSARLLPTPRLTLSDISLGELKPLHIDQAQLNFSLEALFSTNKPIHLLKLQGVQINDKALPKITEWLRQVAGNKQYPIDKIEFDHGKLEIENLVFNELAGQITFDQALKFSTAKLTASEGKYTVEISAELGGKYPLKVSLRNVTLPLFTNSVFDELAAQGELNENGLLLSDIDSRIYGGVLQGNAQIDWHQGWFVRGAFTAKKIALQNFVKSLTGDIDGGGQFQMKSASLSGLANDLQMNGSFLAKQGVISGIDIVETARLRSKDHLPGGRTHFDDMSGDVSFVRDTYEFKRLKINAGLVKANGICSVDKQQISGKLSAEMTIHAGMENVALQLGGTTENLTLKAIR